MYSQVTVITYWDWNGCVCKVQGAIWLAKSTGWGIWVGMGKYEDNQ